MGRSNLNQFLVWDPLATCYDGSVVAARSAKTRKDHALQQPEIVPGPYRFRVKDEMARITEADPNKNRQTKSGAGHAEIQGGDAEGREFHGRGERLFLRAGGTRPDRRGD